VAEFDAFAENYNRILKDNVSAFGEAPAYFAQQKTAYLQKRVLKKPDAKILDFGCGIGNLVQVLHERLAGATLHGFDVSEQSLNGIPDHIRRIGRFTSDFGELDCDYDIAVLAGVLHHIATDERRTVLGRVIERLKPGGAMLVFEHNPFNPLTRKTVRECVFDRDAVLLKPAETIRHLQDAGLQRVRRDFTLFFPRPLSGLRSLEDGLRWCPLGAQYAVHGIKTDHDRSLGAGRAAPG